MRRVTTTVIAAGAALLASISPAMADPSPAAQAPALGKKVCSISDPKLGEISGLLATSSGYLAVNAGVDQEPETHKKIFAISAACKVTGTIAYASGSRSPQDIVRGKDGTIWVGDTGEGDKDRTSVVLWKVPANGGTAALYRFTYPEGDKHDAKALLVNGDGLPIIVTFETNATALLYTPSATPAAGASVPLKQSGKISILPTATENVLGGFGRKGFVGGAVSPDGSKVVLRTQADAYEWDVTDGDVVGALKTEPRVTGLPMEPLSESITYSTDGSKLITVTRLDRAGQADKSITTSTLLSYTPTTKQYVAPPTVKASAGDGWFTKWWKGLSLSQAYALLAGLGFVGVIVMLIGIYGMVTGKKKRQKALAAAKKAKRRDEDLEPAGVGAGGRYGEPAGGGGVYGEPRGGGGNVYGGGQQRGNVYGGGGGDQGYGNGGGYAEPGWNPQQQQYPPQQYPPQQYPPQPHAPQPQAPQPGYPPQDQNWNGGY